MTQQPLDRVDLLADLAAGDHQCTARSKRTGERCQLPSMLGGNVCRSHGGAAPQTRAKAKRRLEQASDVLVQRLLQFALDGGVDDNVALRAIRDALDRAGLMAKTEVSVEVKQPWEELLGDVMQITKAQHEALKRGEWPPAAPHPAPTEPPALPPAEDYVDAEVVDGPVPPPDSPAPGRTPPSWADDPRRTFAPPRALTSAEDAAAETARANRAARVSQARRKRR
jgi:hypothetical protein